MAGLASRSSLDWSTHSWAVLKYGIVSSALLFKGDDSMCDTDIIVVSMVVGL